MKIEYGRLVIDSETGEVWSAGDDHATLRLTAKERLVLSALVQARGRTLSPAQVATSAMSEDAVNIEGTVRNFISNLRKKLGSFGGADGALETRRDAGYRFRFEDAKVVDDAQFDPGPQADIPNVVDPGHGFRLSRARLRQHLRVAPEDAIEAMETVRWADEVSDFPPARLEEKSVTRLMNRYQTDGYRNTIERLIGEPLVRTSERWTRSYPVVVFPNLTSQPLDSVLECKAVDARESQVADSSRMAIRDPFPRIQRWLAGNPTASARQAHEETAGGWNLCMRDLRRDADRNLRMTARLAEYGLILDSCDALIDETFMSAPGEQWPLRDQLEAVENPFVSAQRRAAGIGIAALITVVEREPSGAYVLNALVGRRSAKVGTYPDTWHVSPAGMFNWRFEDQGPCDDDGPPWSRYEPDDILRSMLTEYAEETRNIKKMEENHRREILDAHPVVVDIKENARIEFTGIALDLANLRPEICVLIYVGDHRWEGKGKFELNYEYKSVGTPAGRKRKKRKRRLKPITVARDGRELNDSALRLLDPAETVAAGAAAFWLGVDRAREIFREDCAIREGSSLPGSPS